MATHNQVRLIGYLTKKPIVLNENKPGEEKILMNIKTARREADGYRGEYYCDVIVYYSGDELMPKLKTYDQFDITRRRLQERRLKSFLLLICKSL